MGGQSVLSSISFQTDKASIMAVIGPNGAGKTTLMECLAGLQPHHGGIKISGNSVPPDLRYKHFFYQPDQVLPYPDHGVFSTLRFFQSMFSTDNERLNEIIERLKIESVLSKASRELSRGFQKRLLIAIALLSTAPILLLDEPFEGLDLKQIKEVVSILQDERARGRTLILSIHQIADAERIADQFLLIGGGKILGCGDLQQLREKAGLRDGSLEDVFVSLI